MDTQIIEAALLDAVVHLARHAVAVCMWFMLFISQKVFVKSFCKSQFPHKFVNLFFTSAKVKDKLTHLSRN